MRYLADTSSALRMGRHACRRGETFCVQLSGCSHPRRRRAFVYRSSSIRLAGCSIVVTQGAKPRKRTRQTGDPDGPPMPCVGVWYVPQRFYRKWHEDPNRKLVDCDTLRRKTRRLDAPEASRSLRRRPTSNSVHI